MTAVGEDCDSGCEAPDRQQPAVGSGGRVWRRRATNLALRLRPALPCWPAAAVAAAIGAIVLLRLRSGLQPYGILGAQYIEHAERMAVLGAWHRATEPGSAGLVDELDGLFPPLLHLLTIGLSPLLGHRAEAVACSGVLWLWALAATSGATAWLLSRSRPAALAAASAVLLLPAAHGFATRYYYDLPMTAALWGAVALALATWDRRPVAGGFAAGVAWLAANLLKWPSVPFGALMLGVAALAPVRDADGGPLLRPRRRLLALALAAVVAGAGSLAWVAMAGPESSLGTMADIMWSDLGARSVGAGGLAAAAEGAWDWLAEHGMLMGSRLRPEKVAWYAVQGFTVVLSPLFALPLVALCLAGAVRSPRASILALGIPAALVAFLVLWIPILDERFLLTPAPALGVLAGIGFGALPRRWRAPAAAVGLACGFWVAAEFHLGVPPLPHAAWESSPGPAWEAPPLRGWGIAAGDSVEQRGWSRRDTSGGDRRDLREAAWSAVASCHPRTVLIPRAPEEAAPAGEVYWLDYRSMLAALEIPDLLLDFVEQCDEAEQADLALLAARPGTEPQPCLPPGWREVRRVPGEEDWDVVLLRPEGLGCP